MGKVRVYAASIIFLCLTAIKLLAPELGADMREEIHRLIDRDADIEGTVQAIGSAIREGGLANRLTEALSGDESSPQNVPAASPDLPLCPAIRENSGENREGQNKGENSASAGTPDSSEAESSESVSRPAFSGDSSFPDNELPDAVSAFVARQAEFPQSTVPANVRIDMPLLPFEHTKPLAGRESSGFGYRKHPIDGEIKFHYGTDIAAPGGERVVAFADGLVRTVGLSQDYGNYIILSHMDGYETLYAHLSSIEAQEGDELCMGETLGQVGATGKATGPHLHFELIRDGKYLNPEYYL